MVEFEHGRSGRWPHDPGMTKDEKSIRADQPPPVMRVGKICTESLNAIERRTKEQARHMRRIGMPELQMLEDVGVLIRFARDALGIRG